MKEHPGHQAEAKQDLHLLNAQKMGEHEATCTDGQRNR